MWGAGTRANISGEESKSTGLDASEVLDSASRWLAAEGMNTESVFPTSEASRNQGANDRNTFDAPLVPETPVWRSSETDTRIVSTNEKRTSTVNRATGSSFGSTRIGERPQFLAPVPETAPPPPPRPFLKRGKSDIEQRPSVPPRPEENRRAGTADERLSENTNGSPRGKRKRGRDTTPISIMEGVEGLGQRLKRVCLKAKFHRRARHHVSSEDLSMVGSTEVMPAPVTPPDHQGSHVYNCPPSLNGNATPSSSLMTGGMSSNQTGLVSVTSHSLVTGIVDSRGETVKTQPSPEKKNSPATATIHVPQSNIFLQPRKEVSGKGVLDALGSEHEIIFTESTTSEEEFVA